VSEATSRREDLFGEVTQSASDKLLQSVDYPFTVFNVREDFPGCSRAAKGAIEPLDENPPLHVYTEKEVRELLEEATRRVVKREEDEGETTLYDEVFSFAGSVVEQAKRVLEASRNKDYEGPDPEELQRIVDGGIEGLVDTLGRLEFYAWCSRLRVVAKRRPRIGLRSPRIDLNGIRIAVKATGELWVRYPWWNCYKWCTKWKKVYKCKRIARLTVEPDIAAEAHATLRAKEAQVLAFAKFDRLRIDEPVLRRIPLEGFANQALGDKPVFVYDASKLVATVPVLGSRFSVDKIVLSPSPDSIGVGVVIREVD
jgi:hypothetical protein